MSNDQSVTPSGTEHREGAGSPDFAFLDQALWKQFRETGEGDSEAFIQAWLALQCRFISHAARGVVVLGEPDTGPFAPAAHWPADETPAAGMLTVAERAMDERQGVVLADDAGTVTNIAYPFIFAGQLYGVVAVQFKDSSGMVRQVMRQLQWGAGWIEVLLLRRQRSSDEELREHTSVAFDIVASTLEHRHLLDACNAVVTELSMHLDCDPVSIGFLKRGRTKIKAISHAAQFGEKMNLVHDIGSAMDEAIDQKAVVILPSRDEWEYRVTRSHAELIAAHQVGAVLTIPLQAHGDVIGAITFERQTGETFDEATVELCDGVVSMLGPILEEKRLNDRWIFRKVGESVVTQMRRLLGPHYFGRKLAALIAVILLTFFSLVTGDYRVTSEALVEGMVQRTVVTPFDSYLSSQMARAGELVHEGQVLATLDDKDLALERLRWSTKKRQYMSEYDQALALKERAEANIIKTRIDQAGAQIDLLDEQLARTLIKAPFDGIIVSGDLSQSVGAAVKRGEELFNIAPLHDYRVILEVDETDIRDIRQGQEGSLRLASAPEETHKFSVVRITPIAEQSEGRNYFRVEASLHYKNNSLRPGMEGIGKVQIDERLLIRIWTDKMIDWLQLALWKWKP